MGIQTKAAISSTIRPVICTEGEYEGKATLSVGFEGGNFKSNLTAGVGKFGRLFTTDTDGDSNLFNVLTFVVGNTQHTEEERANLIASIDRFVEQYLDCRDDLAE